MTDRVADAPPLDVRRLEQLASELGPAAPSLFARLLEVVRRDVPSRVDELRLAARVGDGRAVREAAHAVKSVSGNLGLERVRRVAAGLEAAGKAGDLTAVGGDLARLERAYEEGVALLEAWVSSRF